MMHSKSLKNLVAAAVCLALCMALPFLTGQIPEIGSMLAPMHIPVLLCGFLCGWQYGLAVGFIAPLLRFVLFGMPPIFPTGVAMAFELAAYGLFAGLLYRLLPKKILHIYTTLLFSMLAGRIVWGIVRALLSGVAQSEFTWAMFLSGAFVSAIPGIVCHIVLIPVLVIALKKAGLMQNA